MLPPQPSARSLVAAAVDVGGKCERAESSRGPSAPDHGITLIRWLAIVGVLIQHANFTSLYKPEVSHGIAILGKFSAWCVLAFFFISGLLLRRGPGIADFSMKRARRLLLPYLFVSLVNYAAMVTAAAVEMVPETSVPSLRSLMASLFMSFDGFGPQMYFLPYLFFISIGWLWLSGWSHRRELWVALCALVLLLGFVYPSPGSTGSGWHKAIAYFCACGIGVWLCRFKVQAISGAYLWAGCFAWLAAGCAAVWTGSGFGIIYMGVAPVIYLVFHRMDLGRFFRRDFNADAVGAIYLWHTPFLLHAGTKILERLHVHGWFNCAGACILAVIGSLVIRIIVKRAGLERFLLL